MGHETGLVCSSISGLPEATTILETSWGIVICGLCEFRQNLPFLMFAIFTNPMFLERRCNAIKLCSQCWQRNARPLAESEQMDST